MVHQLCSLHVHPYFILVIIVMLVLCTVPLGGWLMEYFLWTCASWSVLKDYRSFLDMEGSRSARLQAFDSILDRCGSTFMGWILFHVSSVGTNGRAQLFYTTFVNNYFGLSRSGILTQSRYGFGVSLTMFDDHKKHHSSVMRRKVAQKVKDPHVLWFDNFSKFQRRQIITAETDVFSPCLWTGVTINEYSGPQVDDGVQENADGAIVPAMPDNLFECEDKVKATIDKVYSLGSGYYEVSLVKRFAINNIPLKIDLEAHEEMREHISPIKGTMKYIHPHKLIKQNIGSNRGLLTIFRKFQEDRKMPFHGACTQYSTLNVDENIYYRLLKVLLLFLCRLFSIFHPNTHGGSPHLCYSPH